MLAAMIPPTKELMDLSILANIGTLNSLNGSIPKDSSNPKLNHPILSTTTNATDGYAFSFLSTTCSMLAAMMPPTKELMDLSILANIGTVNSLNGSIPKDSSNPKLNHPILPTTRNATNGYAFSFLSTTCAMLAAMMPPTKELMDLSILEIMEH
jgi:hypothetical protein